MMFSFASGSHSDKVLSCGRYSSMLSPLGSAYTFFCLTGGTHVRLESI